MQIRTVTTGLIAITATALLLTGCTQQSTDGTASKPTASASASATPSDGIEKADYDNACDGSQAVISGDGGKHTLGDCDAVAIAASGSKITLGSATDLVVEGSNNAVVVSGVERVTFFGSNNTVTVKDGSPKVDDKGTGNSVK